MYIILPTLKPINRAGFGKEVSSAPGMLAECELCTTQLVVLGVSARLAGFGYERI
jgi:hypothetical protein